MKVEQRPVDSLVPYANNARTHTDEQVDQIAASIQEFGWTNPILTDGKNGIIAGHGRLLAARKLGMTEVPVIELAGLTKTQKRAYILADNRLAERAGWDVEMARLEIDALIEADFDVSLTGFDDFVWPSAEGVEGEDDAPEAPDVPVSAPGDVWLLGGHRLMCGDATNAADVELALGGVKPNLMVTDPPYGVEYDADWRNHAKLASDKVVGGRAVGQVINDDNADWREAWGLFPGDVAYVWHAGNKAHVVAESIDASGFVIRAQIIWAKNNIVIGRGNYHPKHEPCWYAVRKGKKGDWHGGRKQSTVWDIDKPMKSETGHSTQKPVECMRRPIANNSSPGQAVYDPFMGSGTTLIAAETSGRICIGLEISPAYVDVAVIRWQTFTGQEATLEGDGRAFSEVMAGRAVAA